MACSKWRKSSFSFSNGNCLEARTSGDGSVSLRNSRYPADELRALTAAEWTAFLDGVKAGEFDGLAQPAGDTP